jgi:hypothetical protein
MANRKISWDQPAVQQFNTAISYIALFITECGKSKTGHITENYKADFTRHNISA